MIKIGDNYYRNLEEQVRKNQEDIARHYEIDRVLANLGIKLIGVKEDPADLPDPLTYDGEYGDAYAVGDPAAVAAGTGYYTYYVYSRPDPSAFQSYNHWLNIGRISIVGPQGPQGETGERGPKGDDGSKWYSGDALPDITSAMKDGYQALVTSNGDVYQITTASNGTRSWRITGNIMGPQGIQGPQGPRGLQGPQGEPGPQGPAGDVGGFINIWGILPQASQLPAPETLSNLTVAYLIGAAAPYDLHVQIGESPATALWTNVGAFNAATLVTVEGIGQNVWDADTKVDKMIGTYDDTTQGFMYGLAKDGVTPKLYAAKVLTESGTIPYRDDSGNFYVGNPTLTYHCANKRYVDDNYIPKVAFTSGRPRVNICKPNGELQVIEIAPSNIPSGYAIPVGDAVGRIKVADPVEDTQAASKGYVDAAQSALGIRSPIARYDGYCSSNTVALGTTLQDWLYANASYAVHAFDVQGLTKVTILSNLGGTLALGNPKSTIFLSNTKEGTCIQSTANINITPDDSMNGPFTITLPIGANYLYISTGATASPHIQGF